MQNHSSENNSRLYYMHFSVSITFDIWSDRAKQASLGTRRFACVQWTPARPSRARGLLSAQWKPRYHEPACQGPRHSSEDFAKDQPLQAWRASRGFSPREGPLLERASRMLPSILPRIKPKGSARPPASRGSFPSKPALSPRQSAHGL